MTDGLTMLNGLPSEDAQALLQGCCSSPAWARQMAGGRPYASAEALLRAADDALAGLSEDEVDLALAGHPRIGERTAAGHSAREQAGLAGMSRETADALADANRAYERRFGHVYLVCATGRSGPELLRLLHERLEHDPATERRVLRQELGKINRIRLDRVLAR